MKMIYTNENNFIVHHVKNLVEAHGIEVFLKNEFAQGAVGEVSAFDAWPELWIINDRDFDKAIEIANSVQNPKSEADWICGNCSETNDASFDLCWKCRQEKYEKGFVGKP